MCCLLLKLGSTNSAGRGDGGKIAAIVSGGGRQPLWWDPTDGLLVGGHGARERQTEGYPRR